MSGPAMDLWDHLTDDELRSRLQQRWCSDDVEWLIRHRGSWPANEVIAKWLRS